MTTKDIGDGLNLIFWGIFGLLLLTAFAKTFLFDGRWPWQKRKVATREDNKGMDRQD